VVPRPEAEGALPQGRNRVAVLPRAAHTYLCIFETRYGG
jgi:hypothetical protein